MVLDELRGLDGEDQLQDLAVDDRTGSALPWMYRIPGILVGGGDAIGGRGN